MDDWGHNWKLKWEWLNRSVPYSHLNPAIMEPSFFSLKICFNRGSQTWNHKLQLQNTNQPPNSDYGNRYGLINVEDWILCDGRKLALWAYVSYTICPIHRHFFLWWQSKKCLIHRIICRPPLGVLHQSYGSSVTADYGTPITCYRPWFETWYHYKLQQQSRISVIAHQ